MADPYPTQLSRREFLILGGLSATAAGLAACGVGSSPSSVAPSAPASASGSPSASAAAQARLRYINHWTGDSHSTTMDWLYKTFQERNPNVTLDVLGIPDYEQMKAKTQTECNAGACPDIMHAVTAADAESGVLRDLTDWMTANSDQFVGVAQGVSRSTGRTTAGPPNTVRSLRSGTVAFWTRRAFRMRRKLGTNYWQPAKGLLRRAPTSPASGYRPTRTSTASSSRCPAERKPWKLGIGPTRPLSPPSRSWQRSALPPGQ